MRNGCVESFVSQIVKVIVLGELLEWGDSCPFGGGLWEYDKARGALLLYGRSFAFGAPSVEHVSEIDWDSAGHGPCPLFFLPEWPKDTRLLPVAPGLW